jgi:UDP-glucose 4-epimerase
MATTTNGASAAKKPRKKRTTTPPNTGFTVAMTGVRSFLGRRLLQLLEHDPACRQVVALDVEMPNLKTEKTTFYRTDLTEPTVDSDIAEILERESVDTLVHLAFLSKPSHNPSFAHELENIGTMYVLNACAEAKVHKFVLGSSTLVYGASPLNPNYLRESHPLRQQSGSRFIGDKVEAELQTRRYMQDAKGRITTVLRPCATIGPTIDNFATRFLSHRIVPNMMGYDPLVQFLHEDDLVAAFKLAIDQDIPGEFNLVGDGVMALSTVFALTGALSLPVPHFMARPILNLAWAAELADAPPAFLDLLRYLCIADGARAKSQLGFAPEYSSKESLLDFIQTQRLRRIHLPGTEMQL